MASIVKNAILRKKIGNDIADLMVKTVASMVYLDASTTLAQKITLYDGTAETTGSIAQKIATAIGDIGNSTDVATFVNAIKTELEGKISGAFHFKGTVDLYADLPSTNVAGGDVYQVRYADTAKTKSLNAEYAWKVTDEQAGTGEWVELGSIVDLSAYSTTNEMNAAIIAAKAAVLGVAEGALATTTSLSQINAAITNERDDTVSGTLANRISGVESSVNTLNGDASTSGSVAKSIADVVGTIPATVGSTPTTTVVAYVDAKAAVNARMMVTTGNTAPNDLTESDLWIALQDET